MADTDSLYVIDMSRVDASLKGVDREKACWAARVAVEGVPSTEGVAALPLTQWSSWASVFGSGAGAMISFETVMTSEPGAENPEEAYLGLLKLEHLDEMIAAVAQHESEPGIKEHLTSLRAVRGACANTNTLRAAYYFGG